MQRLAEMILIAAALCCGFGQTARHPPEFEAATIKPSDPARIGMSTSIGPARFQVHGGTLRFLIQYAYSLNDFEISGGPGWVDSSRYDIEAKLPARSAPDSIRRMFQSLLAERFQLELRSESRELPLYTLVIARNGPKLKPSQSAQHGLSWGSGQVSGESMSMGDFAKALSSVMGRTVVDKTGIEGRFDVNLKWTPGVGEIAAIKPGLAPPEGGGDGVLPLPDMTGPSVFTAIQEQLGLRLEGGRGPVAVWVIDRVERPSEN